MIALPATPIATLPSWRGWIHLVAFALTPGLAGTMIAIAALNGGRAATGAAIYCGSMAMMFGVSALYHRGRWSDRGRNVMRRLDHATIFVFIAGTYTPFGLLVLEGATRWWVLGTVWTGCLAGIALKVGWPHASRWIGVAIYVAVGWVAVLVVGEIAAVGGAAALALLLAGGLLYTAGAVAYALRWPDPSPSRFGFHEVFHLFTVLAAACQYIAVFFVIARTPIA